MAADLHEVVIFAGPHGAGKDTIENAFTASQPDATRHVRYSSRAQAPGEVQGQAYHFVSQEEFDAMVQDDAFIDHAHYPEGSSGIARSALVGDVETYRYTSITTNFEEGLSLAHKLADLQIAQRCLFIGPCTKETMTVEPDKYLGALARRMAERARGSDDIALRLSKAELYRNLFIATQDEVVYIANEDEQQAAALEQVRTAIGR
ncbi:MAG: hypothetical protein ACREGJ_03130 [Candidatus Saccharimonadales bacterium]